jgi:hypothetical protein
VSEYFNAAAFANPGVGNFGNASRAAGAGPGYADTGGGVNAFNRPNFANPNALQGQGDFGTINTIMGTSRQIQLNLRLEF